MDVRSIMTRRVVTVGLDDTLEVIKRIFDAEKFHHLLVIDEHRTLCGVISDRDLLRAVSPYLGTLAETSRDTATLHRHVHQIMTRRPITLPPEAGVEDAIGVLLEQGVSCVPIVDAELKPLGIVTWRDVLKHLKPP